MSWQRIARGTAITAIAGPAVGWTATGLVSDGVGLAVGRALIVFVVVPTAIYVVLGPPLFGAVVSLLFPEKKPPRFGYCPKCEYDLRGNADPSRCPECGSVVPPD